MNIKTAEILCVGTELLLGDIVNTNAAYLARALASMGISVYHQSVVGDNPDRLREAMETALGRADLVITSGGLGPTCDDLTKETAAACFGRKLVCHEPSLAYIEGFFARRGKEMTPNNRKQAMMPEGAYVLFNPHGTAPGVAIEEEGRGVMILLPGPPRELIPMVENEVRPFLAARTDCILLSRNLHLFGIGESNLEDILRERMETSTNPTLAPYCADGEVRLRITARGHSEAEAASLCDAEEAFLRISPVAPYIYGVDVGSIEAALVPLLAERGLTLATAESCTGGLIAKRITDVPGASAVFPGGVVSYANEVKANVLGVDPDTLAAHGAVSSPVAAQMARGVRLATGADIGISTTGIAGPGGGTPEKPVGTVWLGISTPEGERTRLLSLDPRADRKYIRTCAASHALYGVLALLRGIELS